MADNAVYFREQATRCQRLAWCCSDDKTAESLRQTAEDYIKKAQELEGGENDNMITVQPIKG